MDNTLKLKAIILERYTSVRKFADKVDIPATTINNALSKGIGGMSVDKVIRICEELNLDIKTFDDATVKSKDLNEEKSKLINMFDRLNEEGRQKVLTYVEDLLHLNTYK